MKIEIGSCEFIFSILAVVAQCPVPEKNEDRLVSQNLSLVKCNQYSEVIRKTTMVGVAQLVEPRIVIPVVVGSSPIVHPKFSRTECQCGEGR